MPTQFAAQQDILWLTRLYSYSYKIAPAFPLLENYQYQLPYISRRTFAYCRFDFLCDVPFWDAQNFLNFKRHRHANYFITASHRKNLPYFLESNPHLVFATFLNEKKLVRASNPHLSFNRPLPTGRLFQ
jgi:hypothetical protein